jgi:hypothetical protein
MDENTSSLLRPAAFEARGGGIDSIYVNDGVIMFLTSGLFAGVTKESFVAPQRLNAKGLSKKHPNFYEFCVWLIGFTDADGGFSIEKSDRNKFVWIYYLDQHIYNEIILIYIKTVLFVGSINNSDKTMRKFIIRDRSIHKEIIIPIFNQLPLLTSKMYKFQLWYKALLIWESKIPKEIRIKKVLEIKAQMESIPNGYKSNALDNLTSFDTFTLKSFYNPHWVGGFTEGNGSFNIVQKDVNRQIPGFTITQKLDSYILIHLGIILGISAKVREHKKGFYILDTTNSRSISNIVQYYRFILISKKYVEYRIWARAVNYYINGSNLNPRAPCLKAAGRKIAHCKHLLRKFKDKSDY